MTEDRPLRHAEVTADDDAIEQLRALQGGAAHARRAALEDDAALALLHHLLHDVADEMPDAQADAGRPSPGGRRGSVVVPLSGGEAPRRRRLSRTAVAVGVSAGVLSLTGVAAASTSAPHGTPLHALGATVRSALGAVAAAVTPPQTPPKQARPASPTPAGPASPDASAPGRSISVDTRSAAAARKVSAQLDRAEQLLGAGRAAAAGQRLDTAERLLPDVRPVHGAAELAARLAALRAQVSDGAAAEREKAPGRTAPGGRDSAPPARQDGGGGRAEVRDQGKPPAADKATRPAGSREQQRPAGPAVPASKPSRTPRSSGTGADGADRSGPSLQLPGGRAAGR
jgi:hypothetical protein